MFREIREIREINEAPATTYIPASNSVDMDEKETNMSDEMRQLRASLMEIFNCN